MTPSEDSGKVSRVLRARFASELLIDPMEALGEWECAPGLICGSPAHKDNPASRGFLVHDSHRSWQPENIVFPIQLHCPHCGGSLVAPVFFDTRITN